MTNEEEQERAEEKAAIEQYLKDGGKVTVCPAGERTDPELIGNIWTRKPGPKPSTKPK